MITTSPPPSVHFVGAAVQRATRRTLDRRPSRSARREPAPPRRHDGRSRPPGRERAGRPARRTPGRRGHVRLGGDRGRGAGPRSARSRPRDLERLRLRRLRRARVHAGSALPHHPHGKLLRQARSQAVPAGVPRRRTSTRSRVSSATSARPTASGRSRSASAIGSSSSTTCRAPSRSAFQRDSEALLLLVPDAGGRGKGVLSGKVFEYIAAGRPILAVVPPDGAAAELIRETGSGRRRRARRRRGQSATALVGAALALRERRPPLGRAREDATRTGSRGARESRRWPRSSGPSCRPYECAIRVVVDRVAGRASSDRRALPRRHRCDRGRRQLSARHPRGRTTTRRRTAARRTSTVRSRAATGSSPIRRPSTQRARSSRPTRRYHVAVAADYAGGERADPGPRRELLPLLPRAAPPGGERALGRLLRLRPRGVRPRRRGRVAAVRRTSRSCGCARDRSVLSPGSRGLNALYLAAGVAFLWLVRGADDWIDVCTARGTRIHRGVALTGSLWTLLLIAGVPFSLGLVLGLPIALTVAFVLAGRMRGRSAPATRPARRWLAARRDGGRDRRERACSSRRCSDAARLAGLYGSTPGPSGCRRRRRSTASGSSTRGSSRRFPAPSYPPLVPTLDAAAFHAMGSADVVTLHVQYWLLRGRVRLGARGTPRRARPGLDPLALRRSSARRPRIGRRLQIAEADSVPRLSSSCSPRCSSSSGSSTGALEARGGDGGALWDGAHETRRLLLAPPLRRCSAASLVASAREWRSRVGPRSALASAIVAATAVPWRIWYVSHDVEGEDRPTGSSRATSSSVLWPAMRRVVDVLSDPGYWYLVVPVAIGALVLAALARVGKLVVFFGTLLVARGRSGAMWATWVFSHTGVRATWSAGTSSFASWVPPHSSASRRRRLLLGGRVARKLERHVDAR